MMTSRLGWITKAALVGALAACAPATSGEVDSPPTEQATEPVQATVAVAEPTASDAPPPAPTEQEEQPMSFDLTSSAFQAGEAIPARYSCDGENVSPDLAWGPGPEGTQSFALIFDDPDAPAGTWLHWTLINLPAETRSLPEAVPSDPSRTDGSVHGTTSFGSPGYGGPCPPGGTHRYFFRLYALDGVLDLQPGFSRDELEAAMGGHVLAQAELMGIYSR